MARTDRQPRQRLAVEERRRVILEAAVRAFAEQPFTAVSVGSIAAAAGASEALVHRYFEGKAGLYAAVVQTAVDRLAERQRAAADELAPNTSARDRVRTSLLVYLDFIAEGSSGWAAPLLQPGHDPEPAQQVRRAARERYIEALAELLPPSTDRRRGYALAGYFGFLDAACLAWVERGCPTDERWSLVEAALGCLEGALGDWG